MNTKQKGQGVVELVLIVGIVAFALYMILATATTSTVMVNNATGAAEAVSQFIANEHAVERHGSVAFTAADCLSNPENIVNRFYNPETERWCLVAQHEDGRTFLGILENNGECVTCFEWRKIWTKLMCYLANRGYTLCEF